MLKVLRRRARSSDYVIGITNGMFRATPRKNNVTVVYGDESLQFPGRRCITGVNLTRCNSPGNKELQNFYLTQSGSREVGREVLAGMPSLGDLVDYPGSTLNLANIGGIWLRQADGTWKMQGTGTVASVPHKGQQRAVLVTAAHVIGSGNQYLFVPGFGVDGGAPHGVFGFETGDLLIRQAAGDRTDEDGAYAILYGQASWTGTIAGASGLTLDALFTQSKSSRVRFETLDIFQYAPPMTLEVPENVGGCLVAGYTAYHSTGLLGGQSLMVSRNDFTEARRRRLNRKRYYTIDSMHARGSSGGPMICNKKLTGTVSREGSGLDGPFRAEISSLDTSKNELQTLLNRVYP